jgi:hypothetical protein
MTLYTDTKEHAHAVLSEKEAYLCMTVPYRCTHLAQLCNKAFDYCATIVFKRSNDDDATWVASLWQDADGNRPIADILVAVDICPPEGVVVSKSRLEVHNWRASSPVVCLSEADDANVSVPYAGVPLVALQFAIVNVRVVCLAYPGDVIVRYKVLPMEMRRRVAQTSHELVVIAAPHGPNGRIHLMSGDMSTLSSPSCNCIVM